MAKTIEEINEKIKKGKAVVFTAEEIIDLVHKKGPKKAAREVDVVTTGTFGPMCSSSAYLNTGHTKPKTKLGGGVCCLNGVPAYTGLAAVDISIGATAVREKDPRNAVYPGTFTYGGGHVIEDLVRGKNIHLSAGAYGTDCYPRTELETLICLKDLNEAVLFNPRNCYQNYNVAVNVSNRIIYTYMGTLKPQLGNANYCSAGQLSPLLNDPFYKTIGIGTRIFLGGAVGYISRQGTQHNPGVARTEAGVPLSPAGTLAVIGDLKHMSAEYLRGASFAGYGTTLAVGIGIPIPILNEDIVSQTAVRDEEIYAPVVDYSTSYPQSIPETLGSVNYAQLKNGSIRINGKKIPTGGLSSIHKARTIACTLKEWIQTGKMHLSSPVAPLPGADSTSAFKPLRERPLRKKKGT